MVFFLFSLSAIGLVCLIFCIFKLVSPFIGWRCTYDPIITQMTVDIPKPGRYSINIRRDRFWLWKQYGTISDAFPRVNFSVQRMATGENIPYFPRRSLMTSQGTGQMTILAGYFDVPASEKYLITGLPESRFLEKDEVLIRKHIPFAKLFLLILGIILSSILFLTGLILGILILTGNWDGSLPTIASVPLTPHISMGFGEMGMRPH